ncbi:thioesterase II family protein [Streptomyces angustmyceticus]|uniref:thioesterase II family protein n=1 Tax=Streptomyces angustmyceticus TaxID=285578 RepID=UPI003814D739
MPTEPHGTLVLPGAGSFGGELKPLLDELGPAARIARYPGRFGRDMGKDTTFPEVVDACTEQAQKLPAERVTLLGHSFGAYVAHATAAELERRGRPVHALVVVGANAPQRLAVPQAARSDRAAVAAYLEGIDPRLLPDPSDEWHDLVLDAALQDLRLLAHVGAAPRPHPRCAVFAARGATDPLTSAEGTAEWAAATAGPCTRRTFPGGHSDLLTTSAFADWLRLIAPRE